MMQGAFVSACWGGGY